MPTREYDLRFVGNALHFYVLSGAVNYIGRRTANWDSNDVDKWIHIAATYDGSKSNDAFALYKNGVRADTSNYSGSNYAGMAETNAPFYLNRQSSAYGKNTMDDEVAVFRYELSASQIANIYNGETDGGSSGTPGSTRDLSTFNPLVWYQMNEGTGITVKDYGSLRQDGILINGAYFIDTPPNGSDPGTSDCDSEITVVSIQIDGVDVDDQEYSFPIGSTTVTYTVKDDSDNEATFTYTIIVEDKRAPEVDCHDCQADAESGKLNVCDGTASGWNKVSLTAAEYETLVSDPSLLTRGAVNPSYLPGQDISNSDNYGGQLSVSAGHLDCDCVLQSESESYNSRIITNSWELWNPKSIITLY